MTIALVRQIPTSYAHATVRSPLGPIDVDAARSQHAGYVAALRSLGVTIRELPVADDLPDSCFVEDHAVVCGDTALVCRLGHPPRRAERGALADVLGEYATVTVMEEGTLDGGDVLRVGRTLFVGRTERTDADGIAALRATFPRYEVVPVEVGAFLHLKCVVTALDDRTVLLADGTIDPAPFHDVAEVVLVPNEEAYAANVVAIGGTVLVADGFPRTRERLERRSLRVLALPTTEFRKGDGSMTCSSILLTS